MGLLYLFTGPSQISAEIVLLFAQEKGKAVPVHPSKAYGGEGTVPLIFKLETLHEGEWSVS